MMADVRYVVEFKIVDELSGSKSKEHSPSDPGDRQMITNKEPKTNEEIAKKEKDFNKKAFAKFATAYGGYQIASSIYNKSQMVQSTGRGDNLNAVMQSEQNAVRDKVIGSAVSIIGGFAVGGVFGGGVMIANEIYGYVRESINLSLENQQRINQIQAQRHVSNNDQERFVRNATTERIRSW